METKTIVYDLDTSGGLMEVRPGTRRGGLTGEAVGLQDGEGTPPPRSRVALQGSAEGRRQLARPPERPCRTRSGRGGLVWGSVAPPIPSRRVRGRCLPGGQG